MSTEYQYLITDTVNDKADPGRLTNDIQKSSIVTALDYITVDSGAATIAIWFKAELSAGDKTTLDGVVAAHTGEPMPDVHTYVPDVATLSNPEKEVQRVVVQPGRTGYYMCDRDIRISTSKYADADAIEDMKVNVSSNVQEDWGEFSLVGCYKSDGVGGYTACSDQTDAAANAILSVFDYVAKNQTDDSNMEYDFKGGCLWSDNTLASPVWEHRIYAVMAPNIPVASGGGVRFFDGYLYPYQGKWQEAINSLAITVDPSQSVEAARIRFWVFYPQGAEQNHVLRIITYRRQPTF